MPEATVRLRPAVYGGTYHRSDQCDNCWGSLLEVDPNSTTVPPRVPTKQYVLDFTPGSVTLCDRCAEVLTKGLPHPTPDEVLSMRWYE